MAIDTSKARNELANRANGNGNGGGKTILDLINAQKSQIALALPKHMNPDRLARMALTCIRTTPKLQQCSAQSLIGGIMEAAQLGLEPGLLGHCYLVPYGKEAKFIIGYRGMIDLARRSGNIKSIAAHEVYANDFFELEYGLDEQLKHIPWHTRKDEPQNDAGEMVGAYMVAKFRDGGYQIHYMPKAEIDSHRQRSASKNNGPWVDHYIEMAKKTVVRSAWKWLPISVEIMQAVEERDDTIAHGMSDDGMINVTPDYEGGEDGNREVAPPDSSGEDPNWEQDLAPAGDGKLPV